MLGVLGVLATGCSIPGIPAEESVEDRAGPSTRAELTVAGTDDHPLVLTIEPGDLAAPGMVRSSPVDLPGPEGVPWFAPAGPVTEVAVDAPQAAPLTLRFAAGSDHPGDVPIVWRHGTEVGWYPIAAGEPGATAAAERTGFSPHLSGWGDVTRWFDDRLADIGGWATGRTDPPRCSSGPPEWADLQAPGLDILLTCATTNTVAGVERVELRAKNNRGLIQEIVIPEGVAYADVEGQPEYVREAVRTLAGGRDVVLLPPGARLSVGFTRPAEDREIQLVPRASNLALAADLAVRLSDLASNEGNDALLVAALQLQECAGAGDAFLHGGVPQSLSDVQDFVFAMSSCVAGAGADPATAVSIAERFVSLTREVPLTVVKSDRAFGPLVEKWAGRINLGATFLRAADLARMAGQMWENVGELLGREVAGAHDPAVVRLAMTATSAATESFPSGIWEGTVEQSGYGASTYTVSVNFLDVFNQGERGAVVSYPTLGCGGYWTYEDTAGDSVSFTENITYGSNCIKTSSITIGTYDETGAGTISYSFRDSKTGAVGEGTLATIGSG